jgi:hypothetical protein
VKTKKNRRELEVRAGFRIDRKKFVGPYIATGGMIAVTGADFIGFTIFFLSDGARLAEAAFRTVFLAAFFGAAFFATLDLAAIVFLATGFLAAAFFFIFVFVVRIWVSPVFRLLLSTESSATQS